MKESAVSEKKTASAQRKAGASAPTRDEQWAVDRPLMSIVQRSCSGCVPSVQSMAGGMMQTPAAQRQAAAMSLQRTRGNMFVRGLATEAKREPNRTGMPDQLKAGIESISGIDMSDVRVHYNSDRPARLNALAYSQGNQIYLEPGQERHLPHEAWHAVQQKQGRVRATRQMKGNLIFNDDANLENEASYNGIKALESKSCNSMNSKRIVSEVTLPIQLMIIKKEPGTDKEIVTFNANEDRPDGQGLYKNDGYKYEPYQGPSTSSAPGSYTRTKLEQPEGGASGNLQGVSPATIKAKLDEYNYAERQKPKTKNEKTKKGNDLFARLKEIELMIYQWFDFTERSQIPKESNDEITRYLDDVQRKHIKLVDQFKSNPEVTPFSTGGMSEKDKADFTAAWRSLVKGTGMIRRIGSKDFNKEMLSHMGKMMDTVIGREMLTFLNTPRNKEEAKDDFKRTYIGEDIKKLPKAVRKTSVKDKLQNISYSASQAIGERTDVLKSLKPQIAQTEEHQDFNVTIVEQPYEYPKLDSATPDLTHIAMSGKKGVFINGRLYDFGKGTGSYVTLSQGGSSVLAGRDNREIIGPRFISLAHELGHSVHTKAGAASDTIDAIMREMGGFGFDKEAEDVWTNSEEFINIRDVENRMRREYGLESERIGHKNPDYLNALAFRKTNKGEQTLNERYNIIIHGLNEIISEMLKSTKGEGAEFDKFNKWLAQVSGKNIMYLNEKWFNEMQSIKNQYEMITVRIVNVEKPPLHATEHNI